MAGVASTAPESCAPAREEGGCCLNIQIAFDSGLIQTRPVSRERGRFGLMPRMEFLRPTVLSVPGFGTPQLHCF